MQNIKLKELISVLRKKYNISFRKIAKAINLDREKVRRIYNKQKKCAKHLRPHWHTLKIKYFNK